MDLHNLHHLQVAGIILSFTFLITALFLPFVQQARRQHRQTKSSANAAKGYRLVFTLGIIRAALLALALHVAIQAPQLALVPLVVLFLTGWWLMRLELVKRNLERKHSEYELLFLTREILSTQAFLRKVALGAAFFWILLLLLCAT